VGGRSRGGAGARPGKEDRSDYSRPLKGKQAADDEAGKDGKQIKEELE
jgi:hypothetical protein